MWYVKDLFLFISLFLASNKIWPIILFNRYLLNKCIIFIIESLQSTHTYCIKWSSTQTLWGIFWNVSPVEFLLLANLLYTNLLFSIYCSTIWILPSTGGASRWQRSKMWRSPSSPQIHQKYIYMWKNSYRTPTERWQKTSDFLKGKKLLTYLAVWLTGSWCSSRVSGLCLWGGRAKFRTLVHQRPPGST